MKPIHDMSTERLRTELVVADRHLRAHRQGLHGSCYQRCEEPWPCAVYKKALKTVDDVSPVLKARELLEQAPVDLGERLEQAKTEWLR